MHLVIALVVHSWTEIIDDEQYRVASCYVLAEPVQRGLFESHSVALKNA